MRILLIHINRWLPGITVRTSTGLLVSLLNLWTSGHLGDHNDAHGLRQKVVQEVSCCLRDLVSRFDSYPQLVGVRVVLGVTEAGLFPGVVY